MRKFPPAALLAVILLAAAPVPAAAQAGEDPAIRKLAAKPALTPAEQEELSTLVFRKIAAAKAEEKPEFFERYYKMVMDKCPDTRRAHESYWRLTNFYNQAFDPPKHEAVVAILEQFLARYTSSPILSLKKYPEESLVFSPIRNLHQAYEALGRHDKIAAHYDKMSAQEGALAIYDLFDYASALDKTNRPKEAAAWYEKFLKKTDGNEDVEFMREIAQDRIKELKIKSGLSDKDS